MPLNNIENVCPTCSYVNYGSARRCANCDKRLPVVAIAQMEPPPELPLVPQYQPGSQQMPAKPLFVKTLPVKKRFYLDRKWLVPAALALLTVILLVSIIPRLGSHSETLKVVTPTSVHDAAISLLAGPGEVKNATGQFIGVNDGSFPPFDIGRSTQALKQQAAAALKAGNSAAAVSLWEQALTIQSNDAEALIYLEDQRVLASGEPHITLIAGVAFTFNTTPLVADGSSESDLQGVYVAQHEFNTAHHGFQIRVLIANAGGNVSDTTAIVQQIVRITHSDPTVAAVIGWRYSSYSLQAIPVLAQAKIPLISPQSTSDELTGISPYFFRVVAPNKVEAQTATPFAEKTLGFKHPVVFFDPRDTYSQSLAQGFIDQFKKDNYTNLYKETFTTDDKNPKEKFLALIQDAEKHNPDGFIFTSRSNADTGFFQDELPTSGPWATIPIVAGSASYTAHPNSHGRWYIIAVAYHDTGITSIYQVFKQKYSADFNAHAQKPDGYYGYTLADDHAIVAYDATAVTLQAILNSGKTDPIPQDVAHELPKITGANAFQGVSGLISFGSDGNPINKNLFILFVSLSGHIMLISVCSINTGCR